LYGRDPKLPVDVTLCSDVLENVSEEFDEAYVKQVSEVMLSIRRAATDSAHSAIQKAQMKQRVNYNKRHTSSIEYKIGDKVLLRNLTRADRKGGKSSLPWLGPFMLLEISNNNTCVLQLQKGELKQRQNICNIKSFATRETAKKEGKESSPIGKSFNAENDGIWIKELQLNLGDKQTLENNEMLTDKIIDAVHQLLFTQYAINDIETPLLCQASGFTPTQYPCVQIHFDPQKQHWITSSTTRHRIEIADSLSNGSLTQSIQDQLSQKYSCLAVDGQLPVYLLPVKQQDNGVDCSVFAIANAIEFSVDNGNPMANYDIGVMRSHLIQCLDAGELQPFPKCTKKIRARQSKTIVYNITP